MSVTEVRNLDIPPDAQIVLPPHGFIHLQETTASDLDVVNAARVSFGKRSTWVTDDHPDEGVFTSRLSKADQGLIRYLLRGQHGTPFEHNYFKFHVRAPIFVFREWHRHRIGWSYNEESARYSPLEGDFYVPQEEDVRTQTGKPGAYTYESADDATATLVRKLLYQVYRDNFEAYQFLMDKGIAKEIARLVLPVGIYSQMICTCNARSLMAFLTLRNHAAAQREIRKYAEVLEDIFAKTMPVTHQAFVDNGRVGP